ncbi:MAG TPA: hypothetical protein VFC29_25720 [Candidatus Limnocylindrales bacterium]|jgi:hypothetical protein|nr:hypothetical protein [Candidatus Limnocylindrales bacterium]
MEQSAASLPVADRQTTLAELPGKNEAYSAGVSWAAVIGGAFVSAALSLILLALGTGLGFSSVSPWSNMGASASTVGKAAIAWLIVTQIMAFAMGGYLAGRLRTKWVHVHTDEVYFRDTAHGLLVWAVGLVVTASFLASAATSIAGGVAQRGSNGIALAAGADTSMLNPNDYIIDTLFRSNGTVPDSNDASQRGEAARILAHALRQGAIPPTDKTYLAQVVSARTGLSQADAETRVADVFEEAQRSAESARKALAHLSLWLFVALLSGAFCASYAGTIGGKQRDHVLV